MALYDDIPPVGAIDAGGLPGVRALRALFRKVAPTAPVTPSGRVSLADRLFAEDRHRVDLARMDLPATTGRSRSADLLDAVEGADVVCMIVDSETGPMAAHGAWLDAQIDELRLSRSLPEPQPGASRLFFGRRLLLVNLDVFPSMDDAVGALISFRRIEPRTAVVIGSVRFNRHDFDSDRAPLTDASIRLPVARGTLDAAIKHALRRADRRRCILNRAI